MSRNEKHLVALVSVFAAVILTGMKLTVGFWTNSLGILSEAAHSGLDLVAAAITFFAIRIADRPPDKEHNFGHGKVENFSALIETLLLLLTCVWIIYEAVHRLRIGSVEVDASVWAFATLIVSIAIDFSRSRALKRVAIKYDSQALEADALHFSTDIWSSCVVLLGLASVRFGEYYGIVWLAKMDAIAALGVAVIVVWVGGQLIYKSVYELIDSVPAEISRRIEEAARVIGVLDIRKIRTRKSGPTVFAEIDVVVENCLTIERTHEIANMIESAVREAVRGADVVVHTEPIEDDPSDAGVLAKTLAQRFNMAAHNVRCTNTGSRTLELHLEVDRALSLEAAHKQVSCFENEFLKKRQDFGRVISHIEPVIAETALLKVDEDLHAQVRKTANEFFKKNHIRCNAHDVSVSRSGQMLYISLHCAMDGHISVVDAHDLSTRLELYLHTQVPIIGEVTIHVEPFKED